MHCAVNGHGHGRAVDGAAALDDVAGAVDPDEVAA